MESLRCDGDDEVNGDEDFDIDACSDDESILDRMLDDKKDIRVRIRTMTIIEDLPATEAEFSECLLSRLQVQDSSVLSSLTGSSGKENNGHRKGSRNNSIVDRMKILLTDCGSPSQQLLTIKALLKDPIYGEENEQVDKNEESPSISDILDKIDKRNKEIVSSDINTRRRVRARRRLISKSSSECTIDQEAFSFTNDGKTRLPESTARSAKSRASNKIIESVLNIGSHKKQSLALHCALSHNRLFKQATDCGYFWKDNKRIHSALEILKNQTDMIKTALQKTKKRGRTSDDKNNFVTANIVSIVAGNPTYSINDHMKHIDVSRKTRYRLFNKGNVKRKQLINAVDDIEWSSDKKRIKQYPKVSYELMIQIQDWILKHPNVIHSPITADTLLIKDESGKYFQFVFI